MDNSAIIENIQAACENKGVKPTKACGESGAGKDLIANLRKGITPSVEKISKLAAYLGVTTSELLGEAPPTPAEADAQFARELAAADPKTQEIMKQFLKLNKKGRAEAWEYISFQLQKQEKDK